MKAICTLKYDPYFGFSIIKSGQSVFIKYLNTDFYLLHIENEVGHLLGTITREDYKKHFAACN